MNELEQREPHFSVVQDKGELLIMNRHPATKAIEVRQSPPTPVEHLWYQQRNHDIYVMTIYSVHHVKQ